jgi:hypothetical protein
MTVTKSDTEPVRQVSGNADAEETEEDVYDARARDGQRTSFGDSLPDTERVQEALRDWFAHVRDVAASLLNGSFWDEQPPSPQELIARYQESPWTHSEWGALKVLRWLGCAFSIAWSLPLYALAIVGQRFGRALTVALTVWAFWNLI